MSTVPTAFLSSGDLIADRRFAWAKDCEAQGDLPAAAELLAQTLERAPGYAAAWFVLGDIRERTGDLAGAAAAFAKAREADPQDRHGAVLRLARLGAGAAGEMPQNYVRTLFDNYSSTFDRALVEGLHYRGPQLLLSAVTGAVREAGRPMRFGTMLDLGCGTGLAGAVFRPHVERLTGIDLSPGMIAQARAKGIYDRLEVAEILAFLDAEAPKACHLIVAADVFVYLKDIGPVLDRAARVMEPGGLIAFTLETHSGDGAILQPTLRYAHPPAEVRAAIEDAGLAPLRIEFVSTRTEKQQPVPGLLVVAGSSIRGKADAP